MDNVGVDVMPLMEKRFENNPEKIPEFFRIMTRQFTSDEWRQIKAGSETSDAEPEVQQQQLGRFYRFWCLKESFVKAIGTGLGWDLQRLSFQLGSDKLCENSEVETGSQLYVDGRLAENWIFEELLLDGR